MTSQDRWLLPDGIDELLPEQAGLAEKIRRDVLDLFATWGYQLVMPPLVEFADSLLVGSGEDLANHSFRLTDQISGRMLAIRPDITAQVARLDAHSMKATGTNRLCYAGSVLHALPKSLSASRCPILAGAELYGDAGLDADIEIVSLMLSMLVTIDGAGRDAAANKTLHKLTLDIGHINIYRSLEAALTSRYPELGEEQLDRLFDAVQRKSIPDLAQIVPQLVGDAALADVLMTLPTLCGGIDMLDRAADQLAVLGEPVVSAIAEIRQLAETIEKRFPEVTIYLDLAELRGYEYHTGLVFAAYADGFGAALANGGRYDELGGLFGSARPATGFNADIKTLMKLVYGEQSTAGEKCIAAPVDSSLTASDEERRALWQKVESLRKQGRTVVFASGAEADSYASKLVLEQGEWQLR